MALNAGSIEIKLFADIARLQSDMNKANKTVDNAMGRIDKSVNLARRAFTGLAGAFGAAQLAKLADEYKKFDSQLQLSTKNAKDYASAYENVIRISRIAQSDIGAVGVLYARLNNNLREFNVTQNQVASVTENVALALRVNNATVQETSSVMLQLSQSFGSGRLNGQEFLAVAEGAPALLRQLAKSMGVPFGALKELSSQGKITREELLKAFSDPAYLAANREMVKSVGTISSSLNVLTNNLKVFIGEGDKATGVSRLISNAIILLADNINLLAGGAIVYLIAQTGLYISSIYASITASRLRQVEVLREQVILERKAAVETAAAFATANNARAVTMAARANSAAATEMAAVQTALAARMTATVGVTGLLSTGIAALGGPVGALITLLGLAATAWFVFGNAGAKELDRIRDKTNQLNDIKGISPEETKKKAKTDLDVLGSEKARLDKLLEGYKKHAVAVKIAAENGIGGAEMVAAANQKVTKIQQELILNAKDIARLKKEEKEANEVIAVQNDSSLKAQKFLSDNSIKFLNEELALQRQIIEAAKISNLDADTKNKIIADATKKMEDLTGATKLHKEADKAAKEEQTEYQKELNEAIKVQIDFLEAQAKARDAEVEAINKQNDTIQKSIDTLNENIYIAQYGEEAFRQLENARLNDSLATAKQTLEQAKQNGATADAIKYAEDFIAALEKQIELKKQANNLEQTKEILKREKEMEEEKIKATERSADKAIKEHDRVADAMENALTNAIFRGFENGESFAFNFRDSLVASFKTMILRPLVKFAIDASGLSDISATISNVLGGNVNGATANVSNGTGTFDMLRQGLDSLNSNVVGSIEKLGVFFSNGQGKLGDTIGGFLGANASTIATALSYSDAALKLIKGDVKGAAFSAAGTAIGGYFGGPVGAAIGSFLGSTIGGMIGGKKQPRRTVTQLPQVSEAFNAQLSALIKSTGGEGNVTSNTSYKGRKKGSGYGDFSAMVDGVAISDSIRYKKAYGEASMQEFITRTLTVTLTRAIQASSIDQAFKDIFVGITTREDMAKTIQSVITLNENNVQLTDSLGTTAREMALLAVESDIAGDNLVTFVTELTSVANELFSVGDAMVIAKTNIDNAFRGLSSGAIPANLKAFDAAIKAIDTTSAEGRQSFLGLIALRGTFAGFDKQITSMKDNVRGAIFSIASDEQKLIMQQQDMNRIFGELGYTVPGSVQELIALGQSIDFTTKEGLNLANVFPTLVQMFSQTKATVDGLVNSLSSLDSSRFRTLFEFTRAQSYVRNGIPLSSLPSYAVGTNFVPNDGLAMIHQGERIIPASDNARLTGDMTTMVSEIRQLRQEMQAQNVSIATSNAKMQKIFQRWDGEGIPYFRDLDGNGVVLDVNVVTP